MITDKDCLNKWGEPQNTVRWQSKILSVWNVNDLPDEYVDKYKESHLPGKIYMNNLMIPYFTKAIIQLIDLDLLKEIKTWDGCFQIRKMKTIKNGKPGFSDKYSLHSWALAFDVNAAWNQQGSIGKLNSKIVKVFKDNGFDWGGDFTILKDYMHFQLSKI